MVLMNTSLEFGYNTEIISTIGGNSDIKDNFLWLKIELDREEDGRWIADIDHLPGVMVYGDTLGDAVEKVKALAENVIKEMQKQGEFREGLIIGYVIK